MTEWLATKRVASFLNALPYVRWDRFTEGEDGLFVYGWIGRDDGRADFVLMHFEPEGAIGWTTSSAHYSRHIMTAIRGTDEGHIDCQRVDDRFGPHVPNRVAA